MTEKTIPRIGRQDIIKGIEKLAQLVHFHDDLTRTQLRDEMEEVNKSHSTKLFKDIDGWLAFTLESQNRSIQIIQETVDGISLTENGEALLNASNFQQAVFDLLEKKSRTNFTYFQNTLHELDQKVQRGSYEIGTNLADTINTLMKDTVTGNSVTAGAIACILKDLEIVYQDGATWYLDPAQYTHYRGEEEDTVEDIVTEHGNQMDLADLERMLMVDFEWDREEVDTVLDTLLDEHRITTNRYEGKTVVKKVS
jgi:hypothetical protein